MDRLLDDVPFKEDFTGCRDRMVLEMFYATGMRLSELIGLNDVDVDFSAFLIKVTGKRNKQRLIPFGEELRRAMSVYLKIRNEVLPGKAEAFFVLKNGKRKGVSFSETEPVKSGVVKKKKSACVEAYFCNCYVE